MCRGFSKPIVYTMVNKVVSVAVVSVNKRLLQTAFGKSHTVDDGCSLCTNDVVVRHESTEFIIAHYNAGVVQELESVEVRVGVRNVGNFVHIVLCLKETVGNRI